MEILAVLVRYKLALADSPTYLSIRAGGADVSLLVYDNSPQPITPADELSLPGEYRHDPTNSGIAAAYNAALALARIAEARWLLLLDQDTNLPTGFIKRLSDTLAKVDCDTKVVAVVPRVRSRGTIVSPSVVRVGWRLVSVPEGYFGCLPGTVTAINSGAAVRVSFLDRIGGFDERFRLDYLDHWLFRVIARASLKVFLTEEIVEHDLSIQTPGARVDEARYRNILAAEALFFGEFGTIAERLVYSTRLLVRAARLARNPETCLHARLTVSRLLRARGSVGSGGSHTRVD